MNEPDTKPPFPDEEVREIVDFYDQTAERFSQFAKRLAIVDREFQAPTQAQKTRILAAVLMFNATMTATRVI